MQENERLNGHYRARAVASALGEADTGTQQMAVEYELTQEGYEGRRITWYGYFTEKTTERSIESLRISGWTGVDISEDPLPGLGDTEVSLDISDNEFNGNITSRVNWVNRLGGGGISMQKRMTPEQARAFAQRMKGAVLAYDKKNGGGSKPSAAVPKTGGNVSRGRQPDPPPVSEDDTPF